MARGPGGHHIHITDIDIVMSKNCVKQFDGRNVPQKPPRSAV